MTICKDASCVNKGVLRFKGYCMEHWNELLPTFTRKDELLLIRKAIDILKKQVRSPMNSDSSIEEMNNYLLESRKLLAMEKKIEDYIQEFIPDYEAERIKIVKEFQEEEYHEVNKEKNQTITT